MPKLASFVNRFTFGEISPLLHSRTDLGKYAAALKTLENFIPALQGPVKKRGGTRFIAESGNGGRPVILMDFAFSETTSYILEFGSRYLRFYHRGARVNQANGEAYQIATPWGQSDLFGRSGIKNLKAVQSGDVMWIACPGKAPQKIQRYGHTDWRISPVPNWGQRLYPNAVAMFRERLCFASGQTIFMSQSGAFDNFELPYGVPAVSADDPLEINVYGERMDVIQWLVPAGSLLVGTSGGEFLIGETTTIDPFGPENVKVTPETAFGSSPLQALRVGAVVLFAQRSGRKVREFVYDLQGDSYQALDLTAAAEHVTQGGVVDMVWQSEPLETLWAARADGQLLGFTFSKEQEMNAWHRHILGGGGKALSLAAVPAVHGGRDELWLAVSREVGGRTVVYVETLEPGHDLGGRPQDAFFVDSGVTVMGAKMTEVEGLGHLEGHEVAILADGGVQPPQVVTGGKVKLQYAADVVQVGLPYRSLLTTVNFEAQMQDGTAQGRNKRVTKVHLRLIESSGGAAGTLEKQEPLEYWDPPRRMDRTPGLLTGTVSLSWPGGYEVDSCLTVAHDSPLPFLLSGIVADVLIEGMS